MNKLVIFSFSFISLINTAVYAQCDSLVLDLPFSGHANDMSNYNNHGTVTGATLTTDRFGNQNSAYYFDGLNDKINITDNNSLDISEEWTMVAWVKPDIGYGSFKDDHVSIIDKWGNGGIGGAAYTMSIHTGGYMEGFTHNGSNGTYTFTNAVVPTEVWTQLVITRSIDSTLSYYINGVLDKEVLNSQIPQNSNFDLQIGMVGSQITENAYPEFYRFKGKIDDIQIYKCLKSIEDIKEEPFNIISPTLTQIELYPNPTQNYLNISSEIKTFKVIIYNTLGMPIIEAMNMAKIDLSTLNKGIYYVEIIDENNNQIKVDKILKE